MSIMINHKKVRKIMRENNLLRTKFTNSHRKHSLLEGEVGKIADNLVDRNFKISSPN